LKDNEHPITKCDKIDYLLDGMQNVSLTSVISNISMTTALQSSFKETSNILLCEVQQIFPLATNKGKRTITQMETNHDNSWMVGVFGCGGAGRG